MTDDKELAEQTRLLIELNEPEALLESLKRVCQRKAANTALQEAQRWRTAANALTKAIDTVMASQAPQRPSNELSDPKPPQSQPPEPNQTAQP